ncbi:MAG: hypothetical protein MJY91_09270 [Bacteroidales bacterium]|nr:hypothetical protein [Bacteroidales bacterium]
MKRIKSIMLALSIVAAAPVFFSSCQEDAPEINYTINVSVTNDFSKVIEAINSGNLKSEAAIQELARAIDKLSGDQQAKLQAIIDVLTSMNTKLETKLALIEAAINAQTLSLEDKLDLLETAISNLPDYSDKLEAIKAAIEALPDYGDKLEAIEAAISALPDYSDKFDAVVAALNDIKAQAEAIATGQTDIATQIDNAVSAIEDLIDEVSSGNTDAATALAAIIEKLEDLKTAIENIGSDSDDSPESALAGKFSVGAGKQVQFSKGNLVATIDAAGTPTAWKFAANQYDCLGEGGANKTIGTAAGDVDLFGWSTASTTYGISTSTNNADYSGNFVDWGKTIGNGSTWRTLSNDEWVYLFETRTNASSLYKYGVTVCGKTNCVIIAPDNWDTSANPLQTSYDATAWATAEAAGLVCLPAAGFRYGSNVSNVGDYGHYWSSSASGGSYAYYVRFNSSDVYSGSYGYRYNGRSVRLITDVEGSSSVEPEPVKEDPLSGKFSVSSTMQVQFSKGNLVATIDNSGAPTAWKFAANQYDCLGEGGANKTIGTAAGDVDLFGWSTAATKYGISTSTSFSGYSGDFVDWGKNIGDGSTWRTLSKDEWVYLFNTRTNASSLYKYGVTVCGKTNCVIIAPDNWDTSANPLQTSYDATAWATAEAAGLVCLPAAGRRDGSSVNDVGDLGYYWSSTAYGEYNAYCVRFDSSYFFPDNYGYRNFGRSVRLITECQ